MLLIVSSSLKSYYLMTGYVTSIVYNYFFFFFNHICFIKYNIEIKIVKIIILTMFIVFYTI